MSLLKPPRAPAPAPAAPAHLPSCQVEGAPAFQTCPRGRARPGRPSPADPTPCPAPVGSGGFPSALNLVEGEEHFQGALGLVRSHNLLTPRPRSLDWKEKGRGGQRSWQPQNCTCLPQKGPLAASTPLLPGASTWGRGASGRAVGARRRLVAVSGIYPASSSVSPGPGPATPHLPPDSRHPFARAPPGQGSWHRPCEPGPDLNRLWSWAPRSPLGPGPPLPRLPSATVGLLLNQGVGGGGVTQLISSFPGTQTAALGKARCPPHLPADVWVQAPLHVR